MKHPGAATLRPARPQDARAMAEMSRDLIEAGLDWRYTPSRIAALIGAHDTMALVARAGPHILGFAVMHFGDDEAHLVLLCVRPAQRRRGIGRGLLDWLLESARVAGIRTIGLELRADNAAALAFYRQLGFVQGQAVAGYYGAGIAAQRMMLRLGAG